MKTTEKKLQDRINEALAQKEMKQGEDLKPSARISSSKSSAFVGPVLQLFLCRFHSFFKLCNLLFHDLELDIRALHESELEVVLVIVEILI